MKKTTDKEQAGVPGLLLKAGFFIFAFVLILYGRTLKNGYSMDDEYVVFKNTLVQQGIKAIPDIFTSRYATSGDKDYGYRPIVKATFAIEHQLFGPRPALSHFINLLLYAATGLLLFVILMRLLPSYHYTFSLLVTVIFLAHPLHTEVVNSLKNRDEMLSFFFALSALYCSIRYIADRRMKWIMLVCFLMSVSMLSKPGSLTFVALVPLALFYFTPSKPRDLIVVTLALAAGLGLMRLAVMAMVGSGGERDLLFFENPLFADGSLVLRLKAAVVSLYFYVKMLFVPHPLVVYYGYEQVSFDDWSDPLVLIVTVAAVTAGTYSLYRIRKKEVWSFGVLFTLAALSMYLNLVIPAVGIVAERFAYAASLGFCIALSWALWKLAGAVPVRSLFRQLSWKWLFPVVILAFFGIKVTGRAADWKDHYTLYSTDVKKAPRSAKLNALLAIECAYSGKIEDAKRHYAASIDIYPRYVTSLNNLASIRYMHDRDTLAAIALWKRAVEADTLYADGYYNLGVAEEAMKNYADAERYFWRVTSIDPGFKKAYERLGLMYARAGEYDKVLEMSEKALKKGVVADILHLNIGNVMMVRGDTASAVESFEKGLAINPRNPGLCEFLSSWFSSKGDNAKAEHYKIIATQK